MADPDPGIDPYTPLSGHNFPEDDIDATVIDVGCAGRVGDAVSLRSASEMGDNGDDDAPVTTDQVWEPEQRLSCLGDFQFTLAVRGWVGRVSFEHDMD